MQCSASEIRAVAQENASLKWRQLAGAVACCLTVTATVAPAADSGVPAYQIQIKDEALRRFIAHRERIQSLDFLTAADRLWVPATFVHAGESYDVKLRLRGDLPVHWRGSKQSYRVKFKDRPFQGRREINLIVPWDKHYAVEWLQTLVAKDLGLLFFAGDFVNVVINGEDAGLYYQSEHPTSEYLERNGRSASSIFTFGENWTLYYGKRHHYIGFENPGSATSPPVESIAQIKQRATYDDDEPEQARKQLAYLIEFYELLTEGSAAEVAERAPYYLDLGKFARYVALQDFFGSSHGMALNDNSRLYLDPTSGKFELSPWDTPLWSIAERAQKRETEAAGLLTPENPVFRRLLAAVPGLRAERDRVLRRLVADGANYRRRLRERHTALQSAYPDDERLREQAARHDRIFAENLSLLAEALAE
jgi:spore coat protein CotH